MSIPRSIDSNTENILIDHMKIPQTNDIMFLKMKLEEMKRKVANKELELQ